MKKYIVVLMLAFSSISYSEQTKLPVGTYSDMQCVESEGDVLGMEITFIPTFKQTQYATYAMIQFAEGVAAKPELVVVEPDNNGISFIVNYLGDFKAEITGRIQSDLFIGKIGDPLNQDITLKKQLSFWNRGGDACIR